MRRVIHDMLFKTRRRHQFFRQKWQSLRDKKIPILPSISLCERNGIPVYYPEQLFTTHTNYRPVESKVEDICNVTHKEYYMFDYMRSLPLRGYGLVSMQHITNSYVYNSLPSNITERETDPSEVDQVKAILVYSHILNTNKARINSLIDPRSVHTHIVKAYATPRVQRMSSMSMQILSLLDRKSPIQGRRVMNRTTYRNRFLYNGVNLFMNLPCHAHMTAKKPLKPILSSDEVNALSNEPLPNLYPLSPLANFDIRAFEPKPDSEIVKSSFLHTLFSHRTVIKPDFEDDTYACAALLSAFNASATYARAVNEDPHGDLEHPFTVNVVLHNGRHFQFGVFQLNTLNLNGPKKNVFWYEPMEMMFSNVLLEGAMGTVDDYNPHPYNIMKRMHEME